MAVVDLSGPCEFEFVAFFQPIEISGLRIEGPVDGLLSAIGGESVVEGDGVSRDELIDDNGGRGGRDPVEGCRLVCMWWRHR